MMSLDVAPIRICHVLWVDVAPLHGYAPFVYPPTETLAASTFFLALLHMVAVDTGMQIARVSEPLLSTFFFLFSLLL